MATRRRQTFTIPLPSRPPDYVPGSGSPLPRLTLLPPADSTAYIDDRILLPPSGVAADGRPLPKRMRYIIGWHDLPAARLLVPAMDILDYVSPSALEDWEYAMELELDEERARLAAERTRAKTGDTLEENTVTMQEPPKRKKRGRPPAHTRIEAAVVAETDDKGAAQGRLTGGAMSLSTPKKRKMERLSEAFGSDESPSEQLRVDLARQSTPNADSDAMDVESDQPFPQAASTMAATIEGRGDGDDFERYRGIKAQYLKKPRPTPKIHLPIVSKPRQPARTASPRVSAAPEPAGQGFARKSLKNQAAGPMAGTRQITDYLSPAGRSASGPPASTAARTPSHELTPKPAPKRQPSNPTPNSNPKLPTQPHKYPIHVPQQPQNIFQAPKQTPIPKAAPLIFASDTDSSSSDSSDSYSDSDDGEAQPAWDVERIEDMELYEVEGRGLIRYFKVRWAGDWPPEQNPTWEPEENIPDRIVRDFCRTFDSARKKKHLLQRDKEEGVNGQSEVDDDQMPTPKPSKRQYAVEAGVDRPSSAVSGMFVYSSDSNVGKTSWDVRNEHGFRPNQNQVYPAHMR